MVTVMATVHTFPSSYSFLRTTILSVDIIIINIQN